ncbi:amidase signature enzyme [Cucurbitaria berberidis CBS 394.84]|uniref:Amidase signature enzyme n=1 Tax=Cucurbitaria berberidis CBS 394.84 TaxID=1168544 RepID=A0A9P4GH42_9PLEO|nr:amidase signature enzyme [Cucurbitaria berberidis CBS 394.84]KAF1845050.1 amidase signature enzyme [Cucurbitaria berberidis CBS 394.84]
MGLLRALSIASFLASNVRAAVSSTGFTVSLTDVDYFLPPKPVASLVGCEEIKSLFHDGLFVPFTVVKADGTLDIASITTSYAKDDVWQEGFLEAIYVLGSNKPANVSTIVLSGTASSELAPGPYFINAAGQVYEAWRLFSDVQGAFTESAIANGDGSYSVLPAGTVGQKQAIAVPSRLYFEKTAEKPLAGVRIGIKDIYDIKGLRTSNGNRAWYWLYAPANNTAPPVQNLIDAGAIIVGKMITSQFANGETATADWVDYHEAFNPRGDGYQDTSSSSSGGGAGAASYAWLDITLGSDTGGSVRGPSQVQGLYGNRPSHGLVSLNHTMPLSPVLDTPGLLARNPTLWMSAAQAMYGPNITITDTYPTKIKTLAWPTSPSKVANKLLIDFLGNVTDFLHANVSAFNVTASFSQDNPNLADLTTIMNLTYALLITKQQTELVRKPFYADYAAKHDGRLPFVNPVPLARWGWGDNQTLTVDEGIANKTVFMNWANKTFLAPSAKTCSDSLVMYVGSTASTTYRNAYLKEPGVPFGWSNSRISIMSEAPDFVVPLGEAPYNSTITGHVEYLPVTANLMAAKGCDGMLFSLIKGLYEAGILKESLAGKSGVTGGEILLRRGLYEY